MEFDISKYFAEFIEQWMSAEEAIKLAERVRNEVVFPAIQELRYAGRRMVQVLEIHQNSQSDGVALTEQQINECHRHAVEAIENCYKAKHDAIDAAIMHIHGEIDALVKQAGVDTVIQAFSDFQLLCNEIKEVDKIIVESRANRNGLDDKYEKIKKEHLSKMGDLLLRILTKNEVMQAIARAENRRASCQLWRGNFWSFIIGLITSAIISIAIIKFQNPITEIVSPTPKQKSAPLTLTPLPQTPPPQSRR